MNQNGYWLENIKKKMAHRSLIVAAGVDDLNQQQCLDKAGCDLILLFPTRKYINTSNRFLAGFLSFGNTNEMMDQMASDFMPMMNHHNLMAGLNGSDPFKNDRILLERMRDHGFTGIHNYPSMSLVDGDFGMNLDNLKSGVDKEIALLKNAAQYGFCTCGMVRTMKQAILMAQAGINIIIFYLGLGEQTGSNALARRERIHTDILRLNDLSSGVRKINQDIPLLFFDEQLGNIEEVKSVITGANTINGYLLMPVTRKNVSIRQLQLEAEQLLCIQY